MIPPDPTSVAAEEALSAKHRQHVHRDGCHRWFDHEANELLDLVGPAGWCDGCTEDWPCDTTRALNRAALAGASRPAGELDVPRLRYGPTWRAWEAFADTATKRGSGPTRDQTTGAAMMLGWLIDTYLPALASSTTTEAGAGLMLVRKDSGGVFADGTTNHPAIDFEHGAAVRPVEREGLTLDPPDGFYESPEHFVQTTPDIPEGSAKPTPGEGGSRPAGELDGDTLRRAIADACSLTNPRLSEVEWDDVADRLASSTTTEADR